MSPICKFCVSILPFWLLIFTSAPDLIMFSKELISVILFPNISNSFNFCNLAIGSTFVMSFIDKSNISNSDKVSIGEISSMLFIDKFKVFSFVNLLTNCISVIYSPSKSRYSKFGNWILNLSNSDRLKW